MAIAGWLFSTSTNIRVPNNVTTQMVVLDRDAFDVTFSGILKFEEIVIKCVVGFKKVPEQLYSHPPQLFPSFLRFNCPLCQHVVKSDGQFSVWL